MLQVHTAATAQTHQHTAVCNCQQLSHSMAGRTCGYAVAIAQACAASVSDSWCRDHLLHSTAWCADKDAELWHIVGGALQIRPHTSVSSNQLRGCMWVQVQLCHVALYSRRAGVCAILFVSGHYRLFPQRQHSEPVQETAHQLFTVEAALVVRQSPQLSHLGCEFLCLHLLLCVLPGTGLTGVKQLSSSRTVYPTAMRALCTAQSRR